MEKVTSGLAGDSIVVQCLIGIFGELTGLDYQKVINDTVTKLCRKENRK